MFSMIKTAERPGMTSARKTSEIKAYPGLYQCTAPKHTPRKPCVIALRIVCSLSLFCSLKQLSRLLCFFVRFVLNMQMIHPVIPVVHVSVSKNRDAWMVVSLCCNAGVEIIPIRRCVVPAFPRPSVHRHQVDTSAQQTVTVNKHF